MIGTGATDGKFIALFLECLQNREALQADMDDGFHHLKMIFEEAEIASATAGTTRKRENEVCRF